MHVLKAILSSNSFNRHKVKEFNTLIENSRVRIYSANAKLFIEMFSRKNPDKIKDFFCRILDLIYLCTGAFSTIENLSIDNNKCDLSNIASKYRTSKHFSDDWFWLREINEDIINQDSMVALSKIPKRPVYSMQYLVSEGYEHVIPAHKITLLLHVIDGLVDNNTAFRITWENEVINDFKYDRSPSNVGSYKAALYYLCKNYFFNYHRKYNCQILTLFGLSQYHFLTVMTDTRNWYSHFLSEDKKEDRLQKGDEMQYLSALFVFAIRIMVLEQIGIRGDEEKIKNGYYTIHDWIVFNRHMEDKHQYKTGVYQFHDFINRLKSTERL